MSLILRRQKKASALLIVLAFVVLLTGLVAAYFARSTTDRSVATGDMADASADLLARSALDIVVADFKQEIFNGTTITSANIVPQRSPAPASGATPVIPNLIRRSVRSDAIPAPAVASRASAVNSTTDKSVNGRSVSLARWNSHYLIPKSNTGDDLSDPIDGSPAFSGPDFWAPDWVLVTRGGPAMQTGIGSGNTAVNNSIDTNSNYVVGRYAFAVYDEGGLLDFNVAGYPYPSPSPATTPASLSTNIGRKGTIGLADLTAMRITPSGSTPNELWITRLTAWRNYATIAAGGTFPSLTSPDQTDANYITYVLDRTRDFRTVANTIFNNRTDQALVNRKELLDLIRAVSAVSGSANILQLLGTFSREVNAPTSSGLTARWPLSRFDLFAASPPTDLPSIQTNFGLKYVAAVTGPPAVGEHWEYVGATGSTRLAAIPSTGVTVNSDLPLLLKSALPGTNSTGEILSIVASLIDQRDPNKETTWIEYGNPASPTLKAYGVDGNAVVDPSPSPSPPPRPASPVVLNRAFRNTGELGYAYRNAATQLDFSTAGSTDAPLLDLFTYNTAATRAGIVSLNTQNSPVIAAILRSALPLESSTAGITTPQATPAAVAIIKATIPQHAVGRKEIARMASIPTNAPFSSGKEQREAVTRALSEVTQTRTWGLLIDVIAQSGRYPPGAYSLADFVVQGEKRYWLHIAIDRFTGQVIDQSLEAVSED